MARLIFCFLLCFFSGLLPAQKSNDECTGALFLNDVINYCSLPGEFDNGQSSGSVEPGPSCWPEGTVTNDVWFSFSAPLPGALIQLTGFTNAQSGTLEQPSISIYQGGCDRLEALGCSSVLPDQENFIALSFTDLVVGQMYYLRVDARNNNVGSFQLCIQSFVPVLSPESDCIQSVVLCDKSSFFIENLGGTGTDKLEGANTCISEEFASVWYTWTAATDGTLTFTLTPNNEQDDLDFVVFYLPDGLRNCDTRQVIRCMASGENVGASTNTSLPCMGPTGLREGAGDTQEIAGCQPGDDNFLAPLNMIAGETYALIVNNYSRSGFGFLIDFGGTANFLGPDPDFEIVADQGLSCDKVITFVNQSTSETDSIVEWFWNFGEGASPALMAGIGPHDVQYNSFGKKITALTVESSQGCRVTKTFDIDVAPCCLPGSDLSLTTIAVDLSCYQSADGQIELMATGGNGRYLYRLNGQRLQAGSSFFNLPAGSYDVLVQDSKGCEVSSADFLDEPSPVEIFLTAEKDTVLLGFGTSFSSEFFPLDRSLIYNWSPASGLSCVDCPDPSVIPPGTTTYTLTVEDQDGCQTSEDITLFTKLTRPVYAPTAIMPSSDLGNTHFKIELNIAASQIDVLAIYDRWGNQLYSVENILPDDPGYLGWDGRFNGQSATPGVYAWIAKVRFIDGEQFTFAGEFTLFY